MKRIPGPRQPFLIGNTLDVVRDPIGFTLTCWKKYGDIARIHLPQETILLFRPEYIKHVLQDAWQKYDTEIFVQKRLRAVFGNGLFTSRQDETWLAHRRLLQPHFSRKTLESGIDTRIHDGIDLWLAHLASSEMDIHKQMKILILDILSSLLLSQGESKASQIESHLGSLSKPLFSYVMLCFPPLAINFLIKKPIEGIERIFYQMIAERRFLFTDGNNPSDLLSLLMSAKDNQGNGLSDQEIKDELMTLLVGSHETTANTLSWIFILLAQHQEVQKKIQMEVDQLEGRPATFEDLSRLAYVQQVIEETLRLYPPAFAMTRQCIEDDIIDGYPIAKGQMIVAVPYVMHRHPDYWENPDLFLPERFSTDLAKQQRAHGAYMPFGAGPKKCIGDHLALFILTLVVTRMMQKYTVNLTRLGPIEPTFLLSLRPSPGVIVALHQRGPKDENEG